jgi:nucleotide-binding universal stress UspA family protein
VEYKRILAALDRSPQTDAVFVQALELAEKEGATLMLCHCLPFESQGVGTYGNLYGRELINFSGAMQEKLEKDRQEARDWIERYHQKATERGVNTEWDLKVGDPGSAIRELTKTWEADLVVLGRRGRQGLSEIILGSVSNHVVHHVACSVLVVQGIATEGAEAAATT